MGYKIGVKSLEVQPNYSFLQVLLRNTLYRSMLFYTTKKLRIVSSILLTAVEINVHNFHLHLTRAQTNKQNNTQTNNTMAHAVHLYIPLQTHVNIVPCLAGPNCRESIAIQGVTTYPMWCNNLPQVV